MAPRSVKSAGKRSTPPTAAPKRATEPTIAAAPGSEKRKDKKSAKIDAKGKTKKEGKVVRDSFTMPVREYEVIGALKKRCRGLGMGVKKSELLRVGLAMISQLPDERLAQAVSAIDSVKTGHPPKKAGKTN
jgi:hypothetical protein